MSILDLDQLGSKELISQYIINQRGQGLCLPYKDNVYLGKWLEKAGQDVDLVLLVLSEVMPSPESNSPRRGHPMPLKVFDKKICERLATYMKVSLKSQSTS